MRVNTHSIPLHKNSVVHKTQSPHCHERVFSGELGGFKVNETATTHRSTPSCRTWGTWKPWQDVAGRVKVAFGAALMSAVSARSAAASVPLGAHEPEHPLVYVAPPHTTAARSACLIHVVWEMSRLIRFNKENRKLRIK